ncbi:ATP-binding cassette domain-containing protein [Nocardioides sp.]|uniref:ATP-binding cassette domain-containing protein n=1 Tax=Nocardioides sp. TaxID=35761 RepID=UPI0039E3A9DD
MLGRELESVFPPKVAAPAPDAPVTLQVRDLSRRGVLSGVDLEVRAGEIVGLAGLVGSGRTEIARAIFGADRADAGVVTLDGEQLRIKRPADAIKHGIAMIPESRQIDGLALTRPVGQNITLAHLDKVSTGVVVSRRKERATVSGLMRQFDVRAATPRIAVGALSGGNQQKALFARWFLETPRVLIADEPTRGVDIGAKHAIAQILNDLAGRGASIILISSELEELLSLSHRVLVIRGGQVSGEFDADLTRRQEILQAAFGSPAQLEATTSFANAEDPS